MRPCGLRDDLRAPRPLTKKLRKPSVRSNAAPSKDGNTLREHSAHAADTTQGAAALPDEEAYARIRAQVIGEPPFTYVGGTAGFVP